MFEKLPALKLDRNPGTAAIIGLFFGGLGLGIYFRSFVDFLIPTAAVLAISLLTASVGVAVLGLVGGMLVGAGYGYYRAQESNERRTTAEDAAATSQRLASRAN